MKNTMQYQKQNTHMYNIQFKKLKQINKKVLTNKDYRCKLFKVTNVVFFTKIYQEKTIDKKQQERYNRIVTKIIVKGEFK